MSNNLTLADAINAAFNTGHEATRGSIIVNLGAVGLS